MTTNNTMKKVKCEKCNKLFCFRVYRYKHFKNCNGKSYGNIFDNPDQPIRKYKDKNTEEEEEEEEQNDNILKSDNEKNNNINISYKFINPIRKDNFIIKKDYSNLKLF